MRLLVLQHVIILLGVAGGQPRGSLSSSSRTTVIADGAGVAAETASFRASARQPTVGLGETVTVDIDASGFKPTPNGTVVWPFVNGSQFGAFVTCAVSGRPGNCSLILPLPRAGAARVELAVFAEGRDWGGKEGAWGAGMQGACDQAAGCVYPVGQAFPGAAARSTSPPIIVRVAYRRIVRPGGATGEHHEVCMDFEPWFTKLNVPRWEGRAGASGNVTKSLNENVKTLWNVPLIPSIFN